MTLPKIFKGTRRKLFLCLVLNGFVQAVLGLAAVAAFDRFHASGYKQGTSVAVLMGLAAGLYLSRVLQRRHGEIFALDYVNETRLALLEKVLSLSDTARGAGIGLVTTRLSADLLALKNWLSEGLANSIVQGVTLAMLLAGAAFLYPAVAVVLACVVLPWAFAMTLLRLPLKKAIGSARKQRGRLASLAGEQVMSRLTLAHFGRTTQALKAVSKRADALALPLIRRATFSEAMRASTEWALPVASLAALWMLGTGGGTAIPPAAPLLMLLGMTSALLAGLSRSIDLNLAHQLAVERFSATLGATSVDPSAAVPPSEIQRGKPVEFEIEWTEASGTVTRFSVPPGSVVALAGGTPEQRGGVLAAIARLRDDSRLTVTIASQSASRISIRDWRRIVTLSSPRLPLIRDTLGKNLAIGAPSGTADETILGLARIFGLASGSEDLNAAIEPGHVTVPRALAIRLCRSLMRNASVILLDETASASDLPLIDRFLELARQRHTSVITSGAIMDENGLPAGEPLRLPLAPAAESSADSLPGHISEEMPDGLD